MVCCLSSLAEESGCKRPHVYDSLDR
jgi:hypothetical protein